jgi:hypothetical protein
MDRFLLAVAALLSTAALISAGDNETAERTETGRFTANHLGQE